MSSRNDPIDETNLTRIFFLKLARTAATVVGINENFDQIGTTERNQREAMGTLSRIGPK
jgi:hypothetical protein